MKNIILVFFLFCSVKVRSQIMEVEGPEKLQTIGMVRNGAYLHSTIQFKRMDGDLNFYVFSFMNYEYQTINEIQSFGFSATTGQLDTLYLTLKNQINAEKDSEKYMKLGNADMRILTIKNMGVSSLRISVKAEEKSGWFYITSRQLDKLFGK